MSWNESEIRAACDRTVKPARDMLAERLSYIQGARKVVAAATTARPDRRDADLLPFVGIAPGTNALPVGEEREFGR